VFVTYWPRDRTYQPRDLIKTQLRVKLMNILFLPMDVIVCQLIEWLRPFDLLMLRHVNSVFRDLLSVDVLHIHLKHWCKDRPHALMRELKYPYFAPEGGMESLSNYFDVDEKKLCEFVSKKPNSENYVTELVQKYFDLVQPDDSYVGVYMYNFHAVLPQDLYCTLNLELAIFRHLLDYEDSDSEEIELSALNLALSNRLARYSNKMVRLKTKFEKRFQFAKRKRDDDGVYYLFEDYQ
jgi:hypothetical protein